MLYFEIYINGKVIMKVDPKFYLRIYCNINLMDIDKVILASVVVGLWAFAIWLDAPWNDKTLW